MNPMQSNRIRGLLIAVVATQTLGWSQEAITPSHVYGVVWDMNRYVDALLEHKGLAPPEARVTESSAAPMHVYQAHLACIAAIHELELSSDLTPIPIVISTPRSYKPRDVIQLGKLMHTHIRAYAEHQGIRLEDSSETFRDKTPLDAFKVTFALHKKVNALRGLQEFSPSLVFEQIQRATNDLKQVIRVVESQRGEDEQSLRYLRSAAYGLHPAGGILDPIDEERAPADAFQACLALRESIGKLTEILGQTRRLITLPDAELLASIRPSDVFVQTQYILSEINLLKGPLGINSSTPLGIPTQGKTPTDVCNQSEFSRYMVERLIWNYSPE